jgi:hypothetical protein
MCEVSLVVALALLQQCIGLSRRVFRSLLTVRMEVSVGRLPQEVLLEEFYRRECSETVQVGRVRVFEELLAVFNCSVLTFVVQ